MRRLEACDVPPEGTCIPRPKDPEGPNLATDTAALKFLASLQYRHGARRGWGGHGLFHNRAKQHRSVTVNMLRMYDMPPKTLHHRWRNVRQTWASKQPLLVQDCWSSSTPQSRSLDLPTLSKPRRLCIIWPHTTCWKGDWTRGDLPQANDLPPGTANAQPYSEVEEGHQETQLVPLGLRNIASAKVWRRRANAVCRQAAHHVGQLHVTHSTISYLVVCPLPTCCRGCTATHDSSLDARDNGRFCSLSRGQDALFSRLA